MVRFSTAFETTQTGGTCSPDGELLWQKSTDGKQNKYFLCYAPSFRNAGSGGPTGGNMKCDPGSYVSVEAPKFCCRHPRMTVFGQKWHAKVELCADLLAEFDPVDQKIRWRRGPASDATPEHFAQLQAASLGDKIPSPVAFEAIGEGSEWKLLLGSKCKGRAGTLIQWPSGRVEFCPSGSTPVHGNGYMSWQCDGMYKKEELIHCCSVNGVQKCVPNLVDQAASLKCNCPGIGGQTPDTEDEGKGSAKAASMLPVLPVFLAASGWQEAREAHSRTAGASQQLGHRFL